MQRHYVYIHGMSIQIANPAVVAKIERLAALTGLSKTAAVEVAVERVLGESDEIAGTLRVGALWESILKQLHGLPDRPDAFDPLEWDEDGLPK